MIEVVDLGNDVLEVRRVEEGVVVEQAFGWVSALSNHYDAEAYGDDGHLKEEATPRAMTEDEIAAYAYRLLAEQNPQPRTIAVIDAS